MRTGVQKEAATQRNQTKRLIAPSSSPGVGDIPSFEIESDDDSNNEDVTIIMDSDDQGASARRSKFVTEPNSSKCDQTAQTNIEKPQDCDEFYFMGLVKLFKKLTPQKKVEVRMKIERLLFEAEFE
ncbi:uncharacterized protein LOC121944900 isoform X2 [Plectropomus leopardus]|uniref:uncharacterized protein LOC121944900 isoform X2 n=1 Tax=Plectropomus leopardus TaxID=160734 RepID=UPI001C4DD5B4|nr:uncharacterized protein LOC121944900 isoform X2 [Plectropomus leopardus]